MPTPARRPVWNNDKSYSVHDIEETADIPARLELIEECVARCSTERQIRETNLAALRERRDNSLPGATAEAPYASLLFSLLVLAGVLILADMPLQYLLTRIGFPALSPLTVWIIAPFIAVGLATGVHAVAHVATFNPQRPRRSLRICLTFAAMFGVLSIVALTMILYARTATPDAVPYIATIVGVSLWVLGESLPIIAGLISAGAHILLYPEIQARRIWRLEAQIANIDRLLEWLIREKSRLTPPGETLTPPARSSAVAVAAAVIIAIFILAGTSQSAFAAEAAAESRPGSCVILLDATDSVSPESRRAAVEGLMPTVPEFAQAFRCDTLQVGTFADEGAFAPFVTLTAPRRIAKAECAGAPLSPANGMRQLLRGIGAFEVHDRMEAEKECAARNAAERTRSAEEERAFLQNLRRILDPSRRHVARQLYRREPRQPDGKSPICLR